MIHLTRRAWRRQPPGPVEIGRGNALGARIGWLALGSAWPRDLAGGVATSIQSSGGFKRTRGGVAFAFAGPGTASYYSYTLNFPTGNVGTFAFVASRIGSPDTSGMVVWGTNTTNNVFFQLPSTVGQTAYCFGQAITGVDPATLLTNTVDKTIVFTSDGTAAGKKLYIDGIARGSADATAPTSFASGAKGFRFGAWVGLGSFNCDMDCEMALFTPDKWSDAHAKAFHQNPWQVLAPSARRTYFPGPAADVLLGQACL